MELLTPVSQIATTPECSWQDQEFSVQLFFQNQDQVTRLYPVAIAETAPQEIKTAAMIGKPMLRIANLLDP